MYISNAAKLFFTIFLSNTIFNSTDCMLSTFKYQGHTQQPDTNTTDRRDLIKQWLENPAQCLWLHINPSYLKPHVTILRDATKEEQQGRCFHYAINKITGNTTPLYLYDFWQNGETLSSIDIENYFEQQQRPKIGNLAIYTTQSSGGMHSINHIANIIGENTFESKFGDIPQIMIHRPFAVPLFCGNTITFWDLKPKFKTDEGKNSLLRKIKQEVLAFEALMTIMENV